MITDLTSLRWKKCIYYVSDNVIFDICTKKKSPDLDECGTYVIDMDNAPDFIKTAKDGTVLDIRNYPEIFNQRIPFIQMRFRNPETGEDIDKFYPLQDIIEKGDKIINTVVTQAHPTVFDDGDETQNNGYANKFNVMVLDFIKSKINSRLPFDPKNIDMIMSKLPNWLTALIDDALFMTEDYIDKYFAKGYVYNRTNAIKNASETNPVLLYQDTRIGTGLVENGGWYVPINLWQKDVVYELLKALYSEKLINQYNVEAHAVDPVKFLSKDSKEMTADTIKNCEMIPVKSDDIRTFINTKYHYHDCYDIKFESKSTTADTYWEWLKQKEQVPTMDVEETIRNDKLYVEEHYNAVPGEDGDKIYKFFESCISLHEYFDSEDSEGKVAGIANVFEVITKQGSGYDVLVVLISHTGDATEVVEVNDFWIEDFDLNPFLDGFAIDYTHAFQLMNESAFTKAHSRQCVLRCQVGPNQIKPQYIFGNNIYAVYVDSYNQNVTDVNPAFDGYDPLNTTNDTLLSSELSKYMSSHLYSSHAWVNNEYVTYLKSLGLFETDSQTDSNAPSGDTTPSHNSTDNTGDHDYSGSEGNIGTETTGQTIRP